eukprot:SAG31_NODE_1174_length_9538_cov_3.152453_5_plen_33_part_00
MCAGRCGMVQPRNVCIIMFVISFVLSFCCYCH